MVHSYEQGVRFRLGRDTALLEAGVYLNVPILWKVETRSVCEEAMTSPQHTAGTADGKAVAFGVTVRYKIADLRAWYTSVQDFDATLMNIAVTEACRQINRRPLAAAIGDPEAIAASLGDWLTEECEQWGVEILSAGFHTMTPTRAISLTGSR